MKWSEISKKKRGWIIVGCIFLALSVIGSFAPEVEPEASVPKEYSDLSSFVQVAADLYLEPQLKYPDGWEYEKKSVKRMDSVTYIMNGVVLAKNGFGVRSRLLYNFELMYVGTKESSNAGYDEYSKSENWKLINSTLVDY